MITPLSQADPLAHSPSTVADAAKDHAIRQIAKEFESVFLAEMLKNTGINKTSSSFGGGAGEDAFSSFLTQEYASRMAESGGVGIAEHIYRSLSQPGAR